jgi:hypothetical protein
MKELVVGRRRVKCGNHTIVISLVVQYIKVLFLAPAEYRNTGHKQRNDIESQNLLLCAIGDSWPAENILIRDTEQVTGVELARVRVDHIVRLH